MNSATAMLTGALVKCGAGAESTFLTKGCHWSDSIFLKYGERAAMMALCKGMKS